jgi:hypothetical protein
MFKTLVLFFIPLQVWAYCPNIDLTDYPYDTPSSICVDYLGEQCTAVCGWNGGNPDSAVVCVGFEASNKKGPYILTGESCSSGGGDPGAVDCTVTPSDPSCSSNTGGNSGAVDCKATPSDPACSTVNCVNDPSNPACASNFSADISGYFYDDNGKVRSILLNTNLGDDIYKASSKIDDGISNLRLSIGGDLSVTNRDLNDISSKLEPLKDTNPLLQSINDRLGVISDKMPLAASSATPSIDQTAKLNELIKQSTFQTNFQGSIQATSQQTMNNTSNLYGELSGLSSTIRSYFGAQYNLLNGISSGLSANNKILGDIKTQLDNSVSSGTGTGTGTGTGSGPADDGPAVGPVIPDEPEEGKGRSLWKTQYPGGLQTLFSDKMDEVKSTALAGLLNNFQMPGLGDGSFPTVTFDFNFGAFANYGVYRFNDYLPDLSVIISLLKFMVIFWALIGARSDIFGG